MSNTGPLSAETIKNFLYASTATVSMQMMKRGFRNCAIGGVRPLNPKATRLVGPAYTLRYIPSREDLDKPPTPADPPSAQRAAIEVDRSKGDFKYAEDYAFDAGVGLTPATRSEEHTSELQSH